MSMSQQQSQPGLRERKKAAARANVLEIAHRLFHENGFDATTLEQICSEALISKRTFFRYFRDKESLVFPNREERLSVFVAFLEANQNVENPFDSLRLATRFFAAEYNKNKERLRSQQALIHSSLVLISREREIDQHWQKAIADAFSARAGNSPESDLWARVLAGAIMGVVRSTMTFWFDRDCDDDLCQLGLDALEYLEQGFPTRAN
jgi:AcrR family transcriptional regulator